MANDFRIVATDIFLYLAKLVCPAESRHHLTSAKDFIHDDFIARECAEIRRDLEKRG